MARVQLALNVSDLDAAIDFYSKLFASTPAKVRPGYANFAIADPPLKLVLIETPEGRGSGMGGALNHLGVEMQDSEEVGRATNRLSGDGLATTEEHETHLLLRRAGQGVGGGPRRHAVGGLHRAGRRPGGGRVVRGRHQQVL